MHPAGYTANRRMYADVWDFPKERSRVRSFRCELKVIIVWEKQGHGYIQWKDREEREKERNKIQAIKFERMI